MTNNELFLIQVNNSEAACKLYLQECKKLKEIIKKAFPSTSPKGKIFTAEMSAKVIAKRRMNVLGKLK